MQTKLGRLACSIAVLGLSSSFAFAKPHIMKVTVDCPDIGYKGTEIVTNYGTYLAGPGIEKVNSDAPTTPLFQGSIVPGASIPVDLVAAGYFQTGINYNPHKGAVICNYASSLGFDSFAISYHLINGKHGTVTSSSVDEIHIKIPFGLK